MTWSNLVQQEPSTRFRHLRVVMMWTLLVLFCGRVLGQVLVEFLGVSFLPPSSEWYSGLIAYPWLLAAQIAIIVLMIRICLDQSKGTGWFGDPRRWLGTTLLVFGSLYLLVMIIRYVVRMSLYPPERWTGGSIPIFFHWVLATFVLTWGTSHRVRAAARTDSQRGPVRKWLRRGCWLGGGLVVATALVTWVAYLLGPTLLARQLGIRPAEYSVRIERSVAMETTDGTVLYADVYHPYRTGRTTPTILVRIPYSKSVKTTLFATLVGRMWAERGYTVVIQGTRGRYESEGDHVPFENERQDGIDTLNWLSEQSWYDGRVGMWGGSYFGYTQWVVADQSAPGPTALIVQECSTDFYSMFYPGGAFSLESALYWACGSHGDQNQPVTAEMLDQGIDGFPLVEADDRAVGDVPFFNDWSSHPTRDGFWLAVDGEDRPRTLQAPVLLMAGWYDPFLPTQLSDFNRIRSEAAPEVASATRLVVGPWTHAEVVPFPDGTQTKNYRLESLEPTVDWFDQHLSGRTGDSAAPVRLYVMGVGQWRDEYEWPLARTRYTPFYLHSDGRANSSAGDGRLTLDPPAHAEPVDRYTYDPRDPVPTAGGAMLGFRSGMALQNAVEDRDDVLVYTTSRLEENLEVTGPVKLLLYVGTTVSSTDFTAKLVDVFPNGDAYNVCDGILRRRFGDAGDPIEIEIEMWPTSYVFLEQHQVRLEVSSSNFPRFDRNPNTGHVIHEETATLKASQTVFHEPRFQSRLVLPVIP